MIQIFFKTLLTPGIKNKDSELEKLKRKNEELIKKIEDPQRKKPKINRNKLQELKQAVMDTIEIVFTNEDEIEETPVVEKLQELSPEDIIEIIEGTIEGKKGGGKNMKNF